MGKSGRTHTISVDRQALEDQILAFLRDQELPVPPGVICAALGPRRRVETKTCSCGHTHKHLEGPYPLWNSDVNPLLYRLERKGLVERFIIERGSFNPTGAHFWRAT